jgi:phosphatidylcholine synthase
MNDTPLPADPPTRSPLAAWLVHLFTASGTVLAFLALQAAYDGDWARTLLWLLIALAVDGVDGTLARWAHVKTAAPRIDGESLDLIVDYLNYVFVPAVLIWRAGLVPEALAAPLAALILISSLYNFTRRDMKTEDNYFRGFPALWNVVALYFFIARPDETIAALAICALAALTFSSLPVVHPFRVRDYGRWLPLLAILWAFATAALLWPEWSEGVRNALLAASLTAAALLFLLGLVRAVRGARSEKAGA